MAYNPFPINVISTANSSVATLTSGSVFTGTSEDISSYSEARIFAFSNVASATDGLSIQQSSDGTNWDITDVYTLSAGGVINVGVGVSAKFFRIVFTNGGTNQASFRLQIVFHGVATKASSVRPQDSKSNDTDTEEVTSFNMIYDPVANVWNREAPFQSITGAAAQTATVNNIIPATSGASGTNALQYSFGSVQIISTGTSGTFIFEFANADGNYQTMPVWNNALLTGTPITAAITATSSAIIYYFPVTTTFIRVRIATLVGGGSIQALTKLTTHAPFPTTFQIAQATAANLNATVTGTITAVTTLSNGQTAHSAAATGNPLRTGGKVAPTTISTIDTTLVAADASEIGVTTAQQQLIKQFSAAELDFTFNISSVGTVVTLQPFVLASGTATIRNYITSLILQSDTLGAAGNAWILDGQGAIGTSVTIATPGVFTSTTHDLKVGDAIVFTSIGTITGITVNTVYYVTATSFAATTFTIATTMGGTAIQITGSTSAFTFYRVLYQIRLQTAAIGAPVVINFANPIRSIGNGAINLLIPVSLTSGSVYLTANGYRGF